MLKDRSICPTMSKVRQFPAAFLVGRGRNHGKDVSALPLLDRCPGVDCRFAFDRPRTSEPGRCRGRSGEGPRQGKDRGANRVCSARNGHNHPVSAIEHLVGFYGSDEFLKNHAILSSTMMGANSAVKTSGHFRDIVAGRVSLLGPPSALL